MPFDLTLKVALRYWEQLDCPTSRLLTELALEKRWAEVLAVKAEPGNFTDPFEYFRAAAAVALLKKNPDVPGSTDEARRAKALETWKAGEASCYHANERLARHLVSPLSGDAPSEFLRRVRRRLISWLGRGPDDDELKQRARHGPGSTFSSSVANPTAADKFSDDLTLTPGASWHLLNLAGTKWLSVLMDRHKVNPGESLEFVPGNRYAVVPKTALTDRSIGIEPTLNVYFQLAVGSCIRTRMRKRAGWDLDNAAPIHRKMARKSSVDGSFATLDLSNASDTLCKNLVRILLRDTGWLTLMEDLRSPKTRVDGQWHVLEKFSSMGNGYTFELESCIFAAIAAECLILKGHEAKLGKDLFVFGDDIIVPTDTFGLVASTLQWLGFQINRDKSFSTGFFRESCGGDYFMGVPVRGFYLKSELSRLNYQTFYTTHNSGNRVLEGCALDSTPFCDFVMELIPPSLRIGGSARLGDTVLHNRPARFKWVHQVRWVKAVKWANPVLVSWNYFCPEARLACRLTGYGDTFGIHSRGKRQCQEVVWVSDS